MSAMLRTLRILLVAACAVSAQQAEKSSDGPRSIVITFKDGHQQSFSMSEIARVEYVSPADAVLAADYFLGKWEVGTGSGGGSFIITLESDGEASKTLGASHGIWSVEGNEAHISWDDGWHDAIRKVADKHEKLAFYPGTTFTDKPDNVTAARKLKSTESDSAD
jgi:ABC-type Fe3+-hydroxamate transport system substrate-binding protein